MRLRTFNVALAQFEGATTIRALPLAAGLLAAAVRRATDVSADSITIVEARRRPETVARELAAADVLGLSLYAWNERYALDVARRAKSIRRDLVIIAGGPSAPRRPDDAGAFLRRHPEVDALVAGEGERTFVDILRALRRGEPFADISGVATRTRSDATGDDRVRVNSRGPRMATSDFDATGSPYLDGTFDELMRSAMRPITAAVFETNRGCPFSCTFCDWGQATESRVRELPIKRVEAELRWAAENRIPYVYIVDANFGIRPRDLEIVKFLGRLRAECSYPQFVYFHLTKNATERNLATVETLRDAGIGTHVALSMQDFDATVLRAIERQNIRPERALALRARSHVNGIPTTNELLLGLPAQTLTSFRASIAQALTPFPGDAFALYPTRILVNAPMAEPEYRAQWGLVTRIVPSGPRDPADEAFVVEQEEVVVGSRTMSIGEWRSAFAIGFLFAALANQQLMATTLRVVSFALSGDCVALIDALLAAATPRLTVIRSELERYGDAILGERAMSLAVAGFGDARRDVVEAVVARIVEDIPGFVCEASDAAADMFPGDASLIREAIAWDALALPERFASERAERFAWNWPAYVAGAATTTLPLRPPLHSSGHVVVRRRCPPWVNATTAEGYLDRFLAHGWTKVPRVELCEVV